MALRTAMSSAIGLLLMTKCRGATIRDRRALPAVNNGPWVASELGPLIPQQRTCSDYCGMSVWCHQRKSPTLFDHLVGAAEQRRGDIDAERFSGANEPCRAIFHPHCRAHTDSAE